MKTNQERQVMLPKQSTMITLSTPMTQSNTFTANPFHQVKNRQMTPMAGQPIHIPSAQSVKSSNIINFQHEGLNVQHQNNPKPFFSNNNPQPQMIRKSSGPVYPVQSLLNK